MITNIVIPILLLVSLSSCQMGNSVPILTATTHPATTDIPRWQLYEAALLEATIGEDKEGLCEWTILGVTGNEVYVYTLCQATGRIKTAMSVPAVIYLGESGEIENIFNLKIAIGQCPGKGVGNIPLEKDQSRGIRTGVRSL